MPGGILPWVVPHSASHRMVGGVHCHAGQSTVLAERKPTFTWLRFVPLLARLVVDTVECGASRATACEVAVVHVACARSVGAPFRSRQPAPGQSESRAADTFVRVGS